MYDIADSQILPTNFPVVSFIDVCFYIAVKGGRSS